MEFPRVNDTLAWRTMAGTEGWARMWQLGWCGSASGSRELRC